jgi:hypothetical protein
MLRKMVLAGVLGVGAMAPAIASDGAETRAAAHVAVCRPDSYVWVAGHMERRETRRVLPAVTEQQWVPDRVEEICIPAVTERVCIPAVVERVVVPAIVDRVFVPEVKERIDVPGHYDVRVDGKGCSYRVWVAAHREVRIVREAHFEERVVRAARTEDRVVCTERFETRIVKPECRETRVVEKGFFRTVVVRAERTELVVEKVWIPGHWENRS